VRASFIGRNPDGNIPKLVKASFIRKTKLKFISEENKNIKRYFLLPPMRHPNVVKILGYSLEVERKLFLVFLYPRHGRLADHLNSEPFVLSPFFALENFAICTLVNS
jgi:hypothetical protein